MLNSQVKDSVPNFLDEYILIKNGDSIMIQLDEVTLLPKHKFKNRTDIRYYYWFKKKVFKAYPYAILMSKRLDSLEARIKNISSKSQKKKYIKRVQSYVEEELTEQLKKMTRTEGRILIKLVHRQTGKTAFDNIKEVKNNWNAFWYNSTANIFKLSLKEEYKPAVINEDYLIEDVIQRGYISERLEFQQHKLNINPIQILEDKKGEINVDKYIEQFANRKKKKKKKSNKKKKLTKKK